MALEIERKFLVVDQSFKGGGNVGRGYASGISVARR